MKTSPAPVATADQAPMTTDAECLDEFDAGPSPAAPHLARRARRSIVLLMLVTMLGLAGVATATQASATHASYATALVCFKQNNGGAFTGQVAAEYWVNGRWNRYTYVQLSNSGCAEVGLAPGYYVRFAVTQSYFWGATGYLWIQAGGYYRFYGTANWTGGW